MNHANWLLFSQEKLIQYVNTSISTRIVHSPTQNLLLVSNVSEEDIDKLYFLVNTYKNKNFLSLERFAVCYQGASKSINIPGFERIMLNNFRQSDIKSFVAESTLHYPFNVTNFVGSSFTGTTFSGFVDEFTSLIPHYPSTYAKPKTYSFVLNTNTQASSLPQAPSDIPLRNTAASQAGKSGSVRDSRKGSK